MLRIAICDDMTEFLFQIRDIVNGWRTGPEDFFIQTFPSADTLIDAHISSPFDIILLDVVMPFLNGMEAAREIRQFDSNVKIVFLTTSSEYAVESYTVRANNYILKPFQAEVIHRCLDQLYLDIQQQIRCLTIKGTHTIHRIPVQDIEYIEAQNKQVIFSLSNNTQITAFMPLYHFEKELLISDGFLKCHRSYIVNLYRIETYTQKEIKMRSGYRIPISRSCQKNFEDVYFELLFGKAGDL